jgi:hypothetical protein
VAQTLPNGQYDLYVWLVENHQDEFRDVTLRAEGAIVASGIGSLKHGEWRKYGPYRVPVQDGRLDLDVLRSTKGDPLLAGLALFRVGVQEAPPPPAESEIYDSFDRPDSPTLGVADSGHPWQVLYGTAGISGGRAFSPSGTWGSRAVVESYRSDGRVEARMSEHAGGNFGLQIRADAAGNGLAVVPDVSNGILNVYRIQQGATSLLAWTYAQGLANGALIAAEFSGETIRVFVNGVLRMTTASTFGQTATKHGLWLGSSNARADDFRCSAGVAVPVPGISDDFNRANSDVLGMTTSGHVWELQYGGVGISNGQAYAPAGIWGSWAVVETSRADGRVQARMINGGGGTFGIVVRADTAGNALVIAPDVPNRILNVYQLRSGRMTLLTWTHAPVDASSTLAVELSGSTLRVFVNGVLSMTVTNTPNETATRHGIWFGSSTARADDFRFDSVQ